MFSLIILILVVFLITRQNKGSGGYNVDINYRAADETDSKSEIDNRNYSYYQRTALLSKSEYWFWRQLKKDCDKRQLIICPKVRLEDFINVNVNDFSEKQRYRGYIKSRHIDFLVVDMDFKIIMAIELQDSSHNRKDVQEVDNFKKKLFSSVGIPLYSVRAGKIYKDEIAKIMEII